MTDIFDNGTPKYQSATDIYDALRVMQSGEEIGIISVMYPDVSWDGQDYYYTDNASKMVDRWDKVTEYGSKMWPMDVAAFQLGEDDANDWIFEVLCNGDLAKRIGFKKIFVDTVLCGLPGRYKDAVESFENELRELDYFNFRVNSIALNTALREIGCYTTDHGYRELCTAINGKLKGLRLDCEKQMIAEGRAILTAYDDFIFGLKANQHLYQQQETMYLKKVACLQEQYDRAMNDLLLAAQMQGFSLELPEIKHLEGNVHV